MDIGIEYSPECWIFEFNHQKVNATCPCGEDVEIMSDGPTTCECGRMFWLESVLKVDWASPNRDSEHLLGYENDI